MLKIYEKRFMRCDWYKIGWSKDKVFSSNKDKNRKHPRGGDPLSGPNMYFCQKYQYVTLKFLS